MLTQSPASRSFSNSIPRILEEFQRMFLPSDKHRMLIVTVQRVSSKHRLVNLKGAIRTRLAGRVIASVFVSFLGGR